MHQPPLTTITTITTNKIAPLKLPTLNITGSGQPFVWLHGMLNSVESDSVYSLLEFNKVAEVATVIRYDACGKSINGDYRWDSMTDQLLEVVEAHRTESLIIGGTSMGTVTALHFAVKYPEKVKGLILVSPPPAWEKRLPVRAVYKKIASKAEKVVDFPEFLKRLISLNQDPPEFFEQRHPGTRQRLMELRLSFDPLYYPQIYNGGAASDFPSREQIAKIQIPTLIATVKDDENHPIEIAQELNKLMTKSKLMVISNFNEYQQFQERAVKFISKIETDNKS